MITPQNNKLETQILEYFENQENTEGKTPKEDTANILNIIASITQPEIKDLKITYNGYTIEQLAEGWDNAIKERNELRDKLSALELERPDSVDEELAIKAAHRAFDNAYCAGNTTYICVEEALKNYKAYLPLPADSNTLVRNVLISGNNLASALFGMGISLAEYKSYDEVLEKHFQPATDIWCAWKAIMELSAIKGVK